MDEQFDKKLTNHIRGVFDNYEHPGAERGWQQLRKKFPAEQKNNKVAWLWWSSAAAVVLVFFSVMLWNNNQGVNNNSLAIKPAAKKQQPVNKHPQPVDTTTPDKVTIAPQQGAIAKNNTPAFTKPLVLPRVHVNPPVNTNIAASKQPQQQIAANTYTPAAIPNKQPGTVTNAIPGVDSQRLNNNISGQPQMAIAKQPAVSNSTIAPNNVAANSTIKKQRTIEDMFAEENAKTAATRKNSTDKQSDKKVNFSVYAATYFNYAEGSSNQVNAGAGFTSDFKITKKLKLSTGIALAQNSLNYSSGAPQAASSLMAAAPALKQETLFATAAVLPVFKNYNASLIGLDIPINIKYEFNPEKNSTYVSAGLSSGTFIDENYTYRYTYGNGATVPTNTQDQQTAHNSFNNFYFGKMLNFSFGVGYPVGGNTLIIEPFVKYPLGGLGAQDIRFGSGGVNLKFSFKGKK